MKFTSKRSSKADNNESDIGSLSFDDSKIDEVQSHVQLTTPSTDDAPSVLPIEAPHLLEEQVEVVEEEVESDPVIESIADNPIYPDAALSEKQMAALQSVIGSPAKKGKSKKSKSDDDVDASSIEGSLEASSDDMMSDLEKNASPLPDELEKADRKPVRKVFLVLLFITVIAAAAFTGWYYWWTTHATFEYTLHPIVILDGQSIRASDFLDDEDKSRGITAEFGKPDEPFVGLQYVQLDLALGLRSVETSAALYVLAPVEFIEREFAEEGNTLRAVDMLSNPDVAANVPFYVHFTQEPQPLESYPVGEVTLNLELNDAPFSVILRIVDTTPPTAVPVEVTTVIGDNVSPEDFVEDAQDASGIESIEFVDDPDVFFVGEPQTVQVEVSDPHGNISIFSSTLTIILNQEPPMIEGVADVFEGQIGKEINFLEGVTAVDDFGRELEVEVEDVDVDYDTEGTYSAYIWAEDLSGLRTEVEVTVHILSVDPADIMAQVRTILDRTIRSGMNQAEKALAIHNYIRWNTRESSDGTASMSPLAGANIAMRDKRGNSAVFAAFSQVLLTEAGIPNMPIERVADAESKHFWTIINPDDKGWHHFDPFPTGVSLSDRTSMFTDAQAAEFNRRIVQNRGPEGYWKYDPELYPEIVKE